MALISAVKNINRGYNTHMAKATDANQPDIVKALRRMQCTVQSLHAVGKGCPDLLIGMFGINVLAEVKDGSLKPSARALRPSQVDWHGDWRGQVMVLESVDDAVELVQIVMEYARRLESAGLKFPLAGSLDNAMIKV